MRNAIRAFDEGGLEKALSKDSSRPRTVHAAFDAQRAERLRELLHRSPREFGKPTSLWTLDLAAEASFEGGITQERVTGETVRATLKRMGVRWLRAKHWITRAPTPSTREKKRRRDRLIGLAEGNPGWVVGFEDEAWWNRFALPSVHAWSEEKASRRAWSSIRSPRTTPTRRPSPATGSSCRSSSRRSCGSWMAAR